MERLRAQFETNVFGLMRMCQLVLPGMRGRRRGPDRQHQLDGRQARLPRRRRLPRDQVRGRGALGRAALRGRRLRRRRGHHRAGPDHDQFGETAVGSLDEPGRRARSARPYGSFNAEVGAATAGAYEGPMSGSAAGPRRSPRRSSGRSPPATRGPATRSPPRRDWRSASGAALRPRLGRGHAQPIPASRGLSGRRLDSPG